MPCQDSTSRYHNLAPREVSGNLARKPNRQSSKQPVFNVNAVFGSVIQCLPTTLTHRVMTSGGQHHLIIERLEADIRPEQGGPLSAARVVIHETGSAFFEVIGGEKEHIEGNLLTDSTILGKVLSRLGKQWAYCEGLPENTYRALTSNVGYWYQPQSYTLYTYPRRAVYKDKCQRWFSKLRLRKPMDGLQLCPECRVFLRYLRRTDKRYAAKNSGQQSTLQILWSCCLTSLYYHSVYHDDVIKCKDFLRYWPFLRGIHRSPVNSPHKGQWRRTLMFSLIWVWLTVK